MSALALDRRAVEKKDFPIGRRGYEPGAVDAHLAHLAAEVERLQDELDEARAAAAATATDAGSLALAASDQVRLIVQAAETSAAGIERSAREDAERTRADADEEAARTREAAMALSEQHVAGVADATATMLQRVDAMEDELGALLESLRTGTQRLNADLALLQGDLGELYESGSVPASARLAADPEASRPGPVVPAPELPEEPELEPDPAPAPDEPADAGDGDVEGARLIALNMALDGQSRDATDAYLRENFALGDRQALLDEVYATVEG